MKIIDQADNLILNSPLVENHQYGCEFMLNGREDDQNGHAFLL